MRYNDYIGYKPNISRKQENKNKIALENLYWNQS